MGRKRLIIRDSVDKDLQALNDLYQEAFGESVARLTADLLQDDTAKPLISLVATENDVVVGNIIFSTVTVDGNTGSSGFILAPLAVLKAFQNSGIGTALIKHGIGRLKALKADYVLVLGDPNYYQRVGFCGGHEVAPLYDLDYPEAWMVLELNQGVLSGLKGTVQCASSLCRPELW
ncbi:MAG: N-acetyltransferase [Chromatiales bacterium]|nr:N-acetyltransferase [Chromatiales bacterium]